MNHPLILLSIMARKNVRRLLAGVHTILSFDNVNQKNSGREL